MLPRGGAGSLPAPAALLVAVLVHNGAVAPPARPALRLINALVYGGFAALGVALCARPALFEWRALGLFAPVLPWDVPLGRLYLLVALLLAGFTVRLMLAAALGAVVRAPERMLFLVTVAFALLLRFVAGEPFAPKDPAPALLDGLRAAAVWLDLQYAQHGRYPAGAAARAQLDERLSALPAPGFVYRGHLVPLRARWVEGATGPQAQPLAGDLPGTLYVALDAAGQRVWLTALTLQAGETTALRAAGRPLVLQARAGTHSAPGRDPAVPEYPAMKGVSKSPLESAREQLR